MKMWRVFLQFLQKYEVLWKFTQSISTESRTTETKDVKTEKKPTRLICSLFIKKFKTISDWQYLFCLSLSIYSDPRNW